MITNKRSVLKTAAVTGTTPATWTSRYGSITFNQVGREFPYGGINEAGLVVEMLGLPGTEYPQLDGRPAVSELQWIQFALDNYQSVGEAKQTIGKILIKKDQAPLHYLMCDREKKCSVFEFLAGKIVVSHLTNIPALANDDYETSLKLLPNYVGFGGSKQVPQDDASVSRFIRAASVVSQFSNISEPSKEFDYAFAGLDSVQAHDTRWQIVYGIKDRRAYFRTPSNKKKLLAVNLDDFDFRCSTPVFIVDLSGEITGDSTFSLKEYKQDFNRRSIKLTLQKLGIALPEDAISALASYPNSTVCK